MTTSTTTFGLLKAQGADNARTFVRDNVATTLDVIDAHLRKTIVVPSVPYPADNTGTESASAHIQAALDAAAGKPVYLLEGTYKLTTGLTRTTSGTAAGIRLIGAGSKRTTLNFEQANGTAIAIDGGATSAFQTGFELSGFKITTQTSPVGQVGISIRGAHHGLLDDVEVTGLSSHGLRLDSSVGDPDAPHSIAFHNCRFNSSTGGWGAYFNPTSTATGNNSIGHIRFEACVFNLNNLGGARVSGQQIRFTGCGFAYNSGTAGLYVPNIASVDGSQQVVAERCEFDTNAARHILIEEALGFLDLNNQFSSGELAAVFKPSTAIQVGDGSSVMLGYTSVNARFRVTPGGTAFTAYDVRAGAANPLILNPVWQSSLTGTTKFTIASSATGVAVMDDGRWALGIKETSVSGGATYTPNLADGEVHRLRLTGSSATVGPVTGAVPGRRIEFWIMNNSGGEVSVTWDASYAVAGWMAPANSKWRVGVFVYDGTSAVWRNAGWSQDNDATGYYRIAGTLTASGEIRQDTVADSTISVYTSTNPSRAGFDWYTNTIRRWRLEVPSGDVYLRWLNAAGTDLFHLTQNGDFFHVPAGATNRTEGFAWIPSAAGAPTGVPAAAAAGRVAMYYDTTNDELYVYNGSWKSTAVFS